MNIPSKYFEKAVDQLSTLPGVGRRSALRLALDLFKRSEVEIADFTSALIDFKQKVLHCSSCGNMTDEPVCAICSNPKRDHGTICIVEDIRDVMAIESTSTYQGIYHVLGGIISPMDGIGPADLNIESLMLKLEKESAKEIIFALSPTMEGDTTNFYLFKKLQRFDCLITSISRGIAVGSELQYADELTLGRSLQQRQVFQSGN
ncbi:MAG: recombination mediator RecR [Crocinitomicaceae bacterium]|nr:recombination mediator RecR [Crocinitomicaceae bacterium]MDP4761584.1 recombination mediator RecR [Crocinitomicaceae bacterium]